MNIVDSLHAHKLLKLPVAADLAGPDAAAGPQGSPEVPPPEPLARRDDAPGNAPLSFAQQRVWLLDRFEPGSALHNLPAVLRLTGRLNPEALTRALNEIVRRHEVLRTSFQAVGDEPVQVIRPVLDLRLPVVDLNRLGDPERRPEARRLALAEARQPFDPAEAPLLRTRLLRLSSGTPDREQHALLVTAHDIVFDGWSAGVVLDELAALYRAFSAGHSSPLPELPVQYADFAVWQRQRLAKGSPGKLLENQLAYWHKRLTGLPVLELPTDRPRPALQSFRGTTEPFSLPAELGRRLEELAREQGTTLSTTLLAAFQALVGRTSGQQDLAVGAVVAHRDRPELEAMVGPFANTLVLRGDLRGDPSFAELLARVRDVVVGACAHRELPFELLVEELEPERNLSRNPLVQVLFVIQNDVPEPARELAPGLGVELGSVPTGAVMYDLTLALSRAKAGLSGFLEYNTGLFDASTLRRMAGHFHALLAGLTADPEQRLSQLSQLSPAEQQQLLVEWNDTRSESPRKAPIPRLFEVQVERTPDAVAVMLGNEFAAAEARPAEYLSYRELNRQANRLSHHLQALAVGPEVPVGIYLERSPGMVTAILAVLKAGGLYVPLDPTYPRERLRFMIEDSGIPVVLTREDLAGQLPSCSARPFYLGQTGPGAEENPTSGATADNLAYLLYTSGSTGRPKGVACNHVGATDLLAEVAARAPIAAGDRCSWWTSLNFDVSVYEIFSALLAGGSLCIVPEDVRADGEGFVGWLRGERITSAYVSPSMLPELAKQVQREQEQEQLALRRLLVGVEPIAETLLATIREGIAGLRIINGYGPTEATICASLYNLRASADGAREPRNTPIGRPSRNTEIYLLDRHLRPTPPGVPGELEIGGDGLARGYHRRPQLTAERFIPNPFSAAPGALLYRTGDLARTLPSGDLMFLGRRDFQVKVRGFRIELGEIEAAVGRHPAVREAVVVAAGPESAAAAEERRLVAYVVREAAEELDAGELRAFLRESLPSYMVPSALVLLEALPRTPNGKVDRRALPAPEPAAAAELAESRAAPRGPVEEILAGIWAEVLEMTGPASRRVGIHDDFFELGGHSLRATQVASRANTALGVGIGPQLLFEHPTVAELAAVVERLAAADWEAPIEARGPEARRAPLPLSFAQERLWFLHQLQPEDTAYNIAFALHFAGALDPETLRRTFQEILRRHEILRTTYAIVHEEPRQLISPPGEHPLPLVDLHALAPGPRQEQLEQLMRHDEGRPFDMVRGPIFRTTLLRLVRPPERADAADRAEHVLLFCCHHIAFDGWSMGVIARELAVLYRAFAAGAEAGTDSSPLAPLPIQYADFARWQRRWLNGGEELDRQLAWWRAELDTAQPLVRLPVDHPRPEGATSRAVRRHFTLSAATSGALRSLSRRRGATLFMTLAAAFQTLLHRHTGAGAVVVGTPIANRNRRELEGLIGFFVNTQVLRTDFRGDPPFVELLERVRQAALGAYGHQDLPFEKLVEALQSDRRAEPQPLFQALFALQNAPLSPLGLPGVTLRPLYAQEGERERGALLDLTLGMVESGDILEGFLDFDATVFEPATIDALHDHLRRLLEEIAVDPDRRVGDLPIMSETERRQLIERRSEERREEAQERRQEEPEDPQAAAAAAAKRIQGKVAKRRDRLSGAARALLAKRLRGRSKKAPPAAAAIPRRPSQEPAPLSFTQEQLWFLDQLAPGKAVYNMPFPLRLPGRVEPAILAASFAEIRRRHEVLRATFRAVDGTPRMEFAPPRVDPVPLVDLAGLPASRRQKQARRLVATEGRRPFDLARGPVLRILLLRLGDDDQLIFIAHHIVFDAWSVDVLVRELFTLHSAFRSRGSAPGTVSADPGFGLEELPIQYADFAHWQRQWLRGEVMDRQLRYWKQQLAGAPPLLELPCDRPRPAVQSFRGSWLPVAIPRDLSAALTALSRRVEMTLFMTLLAAFKALLHRTTDQEDIVVGSPIAGRNRKEIEGLIGFFVNTLALRTQLDRDASFRELLAGVRLVAMDGLAHQDLPFERLVEELQPERALGSNPLFQVMFALQNAPQGNLKMPGMTASPLFAGAGTAKFDITLIIEEGASGLGGMLEYNTDLFDRSTMARFLAHFERLLQAVVADPDQRLSQLPWMTPAERHQLLVEWRDSGTVDQDPRGPSIHELFEARADAMPDAPAVVCGRTVLSYRELDARATGLAHHLRKLGVVPETVVAIAAERAPEVVVGLLGILKTGGVYLPLDPSYPEDRLAFLLDDAGARVLLVQESTVERLPGPEKHKAQVVTLDGPQAPAAAREPTESPGFPIDPDQLAYLIYTSGTTGVPKGVAVSHRQVLPVLSWFVRYFALDDDTRVLQNLSPCFDFGVFELLTTLVAGGSLCFLPAPEQGELTRSLDAVEQHNLNTVHTTPSFFRELTALAARGGRRLSGVEIVHLGGEAVDRDLVREIEGIVDPRCRLYNGYGPTETSINSTVFRIEGRPLDRDVRATVVPIGHATANSSVYVLDRRGVAVPSAVPGELLIGGPGVARGYLNRPALTAERFVPDPFTDRPGRRLYRSGDLVRWLAEGTIEFLGRIDHQVKIRGLRIELGEIEAALAGHPAVRQAVVLARERERTAQAGAGERWLVAYVVRREEAAEVDPSALRAWLAESLPAYMVPSAVVVLDALPRTATGKVNRRALPAPEWTGPEDAFIAPRDPTEELLAGIWAAVLGAAGLGAEGLGAEGLGAEGSASRRVGATDNFFELGGHSLLATQVVSRIRETFRVELPVQRLFEAPTVAELADAVRGLRRREQGLTAPAMVPVSRDQELPLSFAQQRLWFLDQFEPGSPAYNIPAAVRLGGAVAPALLERIFNEVVRRHEALRTTFTATAGRPRQVIAEELDLPLPVVELDRLPAAAREAEARRLVAEEALCPFDLTAGPLVRFTLLRLQDDDYAVLVTMHHIVSDGWSVGIFLRELAALQEAFSRGRPSPLAELPLQYADFAHWQRQWLRDEVLEAELGFWKQMLSGAPQRLELPTDRPRPAIQTFRGQTRPVALSRELSAALEALSRREGATLYMTLLATFQLLLSRTTGRDDVVVGSPIAGRNRREIEALIGFFVNTLVLRTRLRHHGSFRELVAEVRRVTLDAYAHQDLPFERLVEELQAQRDLSSTPLFQVMFILQNAPAASVEMPGLAPDALTAEATTAKFDLTLSLQEGEAGASGALEYNTDLFDPTTMVRLAAHFERLLEGIVEDPERRLAELPGMTAPERHQLLLEWPGTGAEAPPDLCIQELFEAQVEARPDARAVVCGPTMLSYRELDERARRLADHLRELGIGREAGPPEVVVGIAAERRPEVVVGLLGILKAGGVYLPLDPSLPEERLAFQLGDAGARVLLVCESAAERLPEPQRHGARVVILDRPQAAVDGKRAEHVGGPDQLAYLIYTSGTTGVPKGVAVSHRQVLPVLGWFVRYFGLGGDTRVLQNLSPCFDFGVFELLTTLVAGGTLCFPPVAEQGDLSRHLDAIEEHDLNTVHTTPSFFGELTALASGGGRRLPGLEIVHLGGEAVSRDLVREIAGIVDQRCRLYNGYGPTETSINSTVFRIEGRPPDRGVRATGAPIGRATAGTCAYVLDRRGDPVPSGVAGELSIGGTGVARGYLNRPALTAERFVPDRFAGLPGRRLYRSGDLVRWLAEGEIEFLGRVDHQVKIRGLRIELGEIEAALARHPAVRHAVVLAREREQDARRRERWLVAYAVLREGAAADAGALRRGLGESLPAYMVPSALVLLDALPRTATGKVDRRALPAPEPVEAEEGFAAPGDPTEELLAGIWAAVLGRGRVGVHDNFFEIGGHSLLATQVVSRIREAFRVEVPVQRLFEAPTVVELAGVVHKLRREEEGMAPPPLVPAARDQELPLSFAQQRLWFLDQLDPGSAAYNIPLAVRLNDAVEAGLLERIFNEVVRRHEVLRTTFAATAGEPRQVIAEQLHLPLPVIDLGPLSSQDRRLEAERLAAAEARRPFDLTLGPLVRFTLARLADDDQVVMATMHHIVSDGWSMGVFLRELAALHDAFSRGETAPGRPAPLAELPIQYADFACWQRRWLAGEVLEAQLGYWRAELAGAPPLLDQPTDRPRPAVQTFRGRHLGMALSEPLSGALARRSREQGVTLFMTLLAAFQILLSRLTGQEDIVVGSPIAGRNHKQIEGLIGFFVNTLVLRTDLSGDPPYRELLARVRQVALGAYAHQDLPFEQLVEVAQPQRDLSSTPLFQVMFILQNASREAEETPGLALSPLATEGGTAKFDLTLSLQESTRGVSGSLEYNTDLFDRTTIERLRAHFELLLAAIVDDPDERLGELPRLAAAERHQLLVEWNDTAAEDRPAGLIHELFERQVRRTPEAVALLFHDQRLSYRELDRRANQLAHHLRSLGIGGPASRPEARVGLCAERSVELVVALVAILKSGGAYVALDPGYPPERLAFMLEDAGVEVLLTEDAEDPSPQPSPLGGGSRKHLLLSPRGEGAPTRAEEAPSHAGDAGGPENLAYVIYTSGSTGRPKGVAITHRSAVVMLQWAREVFSAAELAGVLASTSICFDLSVFELFAPLCWGGRVILARDALELPSLQAAQEVRLINTVPSAIAELIELEALPSSVRTVNLAGEVLKGALVERVYRQQTIGRVLNLYGPSEDTTYSTWARIDRRGGEPTIGWPVSGTGAYVLDRRQRPVAIGVVGELYLGGAGLARGYLDRPRQTAESFVPDPFRGEAGARLYRTGDLARRLADGRLEFLGRIDHQVKVRGFRIELGEIEAILSRSPSVRECAVLVREARPRDLELVAYVATAPDSAAQPRELRDFLQERLPDYMVPSAFVLLDALPLTPNRKVDRAALARRSPDPNVPDHEATGVAPRDALELELTRIWEELLGIQPVGIRSNFFHLGGHSLLAVRLMARIRHQLGRELPLATLFQNSTVERLAAILRQQAGEMRRRALVAIQPEGAAPPFFCVHPVGGNVLCYGELARYLGNDQPFFGLQVPDRRGELFLTEIGEMAEHYVQDMREVQPEGPYRLGGWSMGGVVAFEMARRLAGENQRVERLVLIDSVAPAADRGRAPETDDVTLALLYARDQAGISDTRLPVSLADLKAFATAEEVLTSLYEKMQAAHLVPPGLEFSQVARLFEMFRINIRATERYGASTYPGRLVLLKAGAPLSEEPQAPDLGWGGLAEGGVELGEIPGDHYSILREPNVQALADRLRKILDSA